jgi:hypothetical protein
MKFDFEYWKNLAKNDPMLFEKKRSEAIETLIRSCREENQLRLRQLQWRIDGIRRKHDSHTGALVEMQQLVHESCEELMSTLEEVSRRLEQLSDELLQAPMSPNAHGERAGSNFLFWRFFVINMHCNHIYGPIV